MSISADRIALLDEMLEQSYESGPQHCYVYDTYYNATPTQAGYLSATLVVFDWLMRVDGDLGAIDCPRGGVSLRHDERLLVAFAGEDSIQ